MKEGRKSNKIVSLVLAAIMMVSVFAVSTPEQVQAAGELSFKGSGTSTVAITDDECAYVTGKENYIKFKPSKTGYVTVTIKNNSTAASGGAAGFLTFCNGSKSPLGQNQEYFDTIGEGSRYYTRTYGVKKGKTYFFKIKSVGGVKITAKAVSVKKGTNNSRSKAKTLGKNKTAKGVIIAGENKADWYKIKVTKRQQVKMRIIFLRLYVLHFGYIKRPHNGFVSAYYEIFLFIPYSTKSTRSAEVCIHRALPYSSGSSCPSPSSGSSGSSGSSFGKSGLSIPPRIPSSSRL